MDKEEPTNTSGLNADSGGKTPQEELEELLNQSQQSSQGAASGIRLPEGASGSDGGRKGWLPWTIGILAGLLLVATGFFILQGITFGLVEVTFEFNESDVAVRIDQQSHGELSSGAVVKLKTGSHRVGLSKDGFLETIETISVTRDPDQIFSFQVLPVPVLEKIVSSGVDYVRLSYDGEEISYLDPTDSVFKSISTDDRQEAVLFRGSHSGVSEIAWSPVAQAAIVRISGRPGLANVLDNRSVRGAYVPLGERPIQGTANYDGKTNWLFDDSQQTAAGWQPVWLNESVRQAAFSSNGEFIVYLYEPVGGEYSLVQAWTDGSEWERVILEMPGFEDPTLTWSRDNRHLLVEDVDRLWVVDMVAKTVLDNVLPDWMPGTNYALSTSGDQLAYLADTDTGAVLKIYNFFDETTEVVSEIDEVGEDFVFTWMSNNSLVYVSSNQSVVKYELDSGDETKIPFVGEAIDLDVVSLEYSLIGRMLMLAATDGVWIMQI